MMKNTAELETLTNSDIGHIAEATVANDGTYSFRFKFGGFTFDENDKVSNYKVMLNINGQDATPSITKAIVEKPLLPVRVELSLEDSIATALFTVEEDAQVTSSTYNLILAFYNEANNLIDVKFANKKNITAGGMTDSIGVPVPTGTKTVKAFVWDSIEKQIPLADFDMATVK